MAASVADIEQALRRDLGDAVKAKMSDAIINGLAPTNAHESAIRVQGFLTTKIAAPRRRKRGFCLRMDYAAVHARSEC